MESRVQYTQQPHKQFYDMNMQHNRQSIGDIIEQLPVDKSVPSHNEIRITEQLFKKKKSMFHKILHNTKNILILGGLFIIFSLHFVDNLIIKCIPVAGTSQYILIGVKTLLFMFSYFIIKNLYLARKNNQH